MNTADAAITANAAIKTANINHDHNINQAMVTGTNTQQAVATASNDVDESLSSIA